MLQNVTNREFCSNMNFYHRKDLEIAYDPIATRPLHAKCMFSEAIFFIRCKPFQTESSLTLEDTANFTPKFDEVLGCCFPSNLLELGNKAMVFFPEQNFMDQ